MAGKQDEIVTEYLGINPTTFEVEGVSEWRSGKLTKSRRDGMSQTSHVGPGRNVESEIGIVYGLTDIISYPVWMWDSASVKQQRQELQAKADAMKAKDNDPAG